MPAIETYVAILNPLHEKAGSGIYPEEFILLVTSDENLREALRATLWGRAWEFADAIQAAQAARSEVVLYYM